MNIGRKILIILFSSFVGIFFNPELPFASDTVAFTDLSGATETVIIEKVVEEAPVTIDTPEVVETPAPSAIKPTPSAPAKEVVKSQSANRIDIAGRSLEIVDVSDTAVNSGNHVNKFSSKFLYGHNTANVFGGLYNMSVGNTFSVTDDGVTKNYQVKAIVIYEKVNDYTLRLDGKDIKMNIVAKARYNGTNYDLSLMTCYGTSYGNGDASHRLVLFANAI